MVQVGCYAEFSYNNSYQKSPKMAPFEALSPITKKNKAWTLFGSTFILGLPLCQRRATATLLLSKCRQVGPKCPSHRAYSSSCDALVRPRLPPRNAAALCDALMTPRPPSHDLNMVLLNPDPSIGLTPPDAGVEPLNRRHRPPPPP